MEYVYKQTESSPDLYTVGFYTPDNEWEAESDHPNREAAGDRVAYLNGELITKKVLPELVKAYAKEDGSEGTATYRDLVTDILHLAKETLNLDPRDVVCNITSSAEEVFEEESE